MDISWAGLFDPNGSPYLVLPALIALYLALCLRRRYKRRAESLKPIHYFSYITHSSAAAVCAECGVEISERAKRFCLSNPRRFGGMTYCFWHRRKR
jgi:hypothetical protein